jgi:hypothetical protein
MTSKELILQTNRLKQQLDAAQKSIGAYTQALEFLRTFAGVKSAFYEQAKKAEGYSDEYRGKITSSILHSFAQYLESGLIEEITPERKAQLDVVSDLLGQADTLLRDNKYHPAAAAVLIGATLEEFLRTWAESKGLSLGNKSPTIDSYGKLLREADLITKQDIKDLTAWGGIRNDAAHGIWDNVKSAEKISLMLQGVNLFMRKYEKGNKVD